MYNHDRAAYSIKDAAHLLSISRSQMYKLLGRGDLNSIRIGTRHLITADEIDRLTQQNQTATSNDFEASLAEAVGGS